MPLTASTSASTSSSVLYSEADARTDIFAFGAVLYTVVTGDNIVSALTGIVERALNTAV